ncbi:S-arrestin Retinal S-antigen [Takifugu flavidus]|uniref:S-arrestin n=1 Tax=Takifugu flavidus TaxID=433684 RepID=A0A5C6PA37_9TELE|nr:S-arrestin Retinal S-antigen [Takifugu flavidus]
MSLLLWLQVLLSTIMSPKHTIFKKVSSDKTLTIYMDKRDFVDHCDFVDPVDGVIKIDPQQLRGRKVYVMLSCTFKYGHKGVDVMGVAFRRDLFVVTRQVYPELQDKEQLTHTKVQRKLLQKLGDDAFPFFFEFPDNLPCSVALQPGPSDVGKVSDSSSSSSSSYVDAWSHGSLIDRNVLWSLRSLVRIGIRKIQFSPGDSRVVPVAETSFEFVMSEKPLTIKLSMPREMFYHGEPVPVSVEINNSSSRNIKDISLSARTPVLLVHLFSSYTCSARTPVLLVHLFSSYTCSARTPVLLVHLFSSYTCSARTPVSSYTCSARTPDHVQHWWARERDPSGSRDPQVPAVEQVTTVVLYSNDKYVKSVAKEETSDLVPSGTSLKKDYVLYPLLGYNKDRRGIALDGHLKHEDTNLASSSIVKQEVLKEVQGILVSYKVVVRMMASGTIGSSEVSLELPFKLMHPKPDSVEEEHLSRWGWGPVGVLWGSCGGPVGSSGVLWGSLNPPPAQVPAGPSGSSSVTLHNMLDVAVSAN